MPFAVRKTNTAGFECKVEGDFGISRTSTAVPMMEKLINIAAALVVVAGLTGQLPQTIKAIEIAKLRLIKESQASKWPKAMLLQEAK